MRWEAHIAWRYIFAKKRHNAIHVVSGVSAAGVAVVTAAMVCVLSVMNGFSEVVQQLYSQFDPQVKVLPKEGKFIERADSLYTALSALDCVELVSEELRETALIQYKEHRMPAIIMGVDDAFEQITHIDSIITDGYYSLYDGAFERAVLGRGLAIELGMNAHFVGGIHLYAPKRVGAVNRLRPEQSLNEGVAFIAGTFAVEQAEYDNRVMLVSLPLARSLFDCDSTLVSAFNLQVKDGVKLAQAKKAIAAVVGEECKVLDRQEQQADFFRVVNIEKLLTMLLLFFILLVACFNTIGSLSMLIIDKQEDIRIFSHLGANESMIRRIFLFEGWMVGAIGAGIGLLLGLGLCLGQEHWGWLKMGNGSDYILSSYPVQVQGADILFVLLCVLLLTGLTSWIPARKIAIRQAS